MARSASAPRAPRPRLRSQGLSIDTGRRPLSIGSTARRGSRQPATSPAVDDLDRVSPRPKGGGRCYAARWSAKSNGSEAESGHLHPTPGCKGVASRDAVERAGEREEDGEERGGGLLRPINSVAFQSPACPGRCRLGTEDFGGGGCQGRLAEPLGKKKPALLVDMRTRRTLTGQGSAFLPPGLPPPRGKQECPGNLSRLALRPGPGLPD
ncbi:hypothetical protein CDD83_8141 [Cordyceps sp. RAO-2017]|nr:hypothetical protein CDD83_8141 [Cordyceps sp. RAO-2017]